MFTSVQPNQPNHHLKVKKGFFIAGMALANKERMIKRFTYKELTLIIGIIVALVIVFAVWSNKNAEGTSLLPSVKPKIEAHSLRDIAKQAVAQVLALTIH